MYIYLVFSKTGTWLSRIIKFLVKTKYVHVSIGFNQELTNMYSFGRLKPKNPFLGGFVQEDLSNGIYKLAKDPECLVYKIRVTTGQYNELLKAIQEYSSDAALYRYNFLGLIAAGVNIRIKRKRHYFCSQFVSQLLMTIGVLEIEKPPELIRPTDLLLHIKDKEEIFAGYVQEYVTLYSKTN